LLALGASYAYAQQGALRGVVRDSAGTPISDASVGIVALRQLARTDENGHFVFRKLPPGEIEISVRRLGYEPRTVLVVVTATTIDSLSVNLVPQPEVLAGIAVSTSAVRQRQWIEDFYQRRTRGLGTYVTHDQITARRASVTTDVLRSVPGLRVVRLRGGGQGVRFMSSASFRRDCMPMIWVDGQRAPGMEIDDVPVHNVEGIELYNGPSTTPMQFSQGPDALMCGTIVVWSRVPG
jgi:iron complex outermembrane receptor protein